MDLDTIAICFLLTSLPVGYCRTECKISIPDTELNRLKKELLCGYDKRVNPKTSESNATNVKMFLALRRFTFMESYEAVRVYYGMSLVWQDDRLGWEPSHFGEIEHFIISYSSIWTPKIGWKTRDTDNDNLYKGMIPCHVASSGMVTCISWSSFHTICQSDFTHWPYDSHVCEARLAPWLLHRREVALWPENHNIAYTQSFQRNTEWALQTEGTWIRSENFENATFDYTEVILTLILQRHSGIYEATVFIPALVLAMLTLAASRIEAGCPTRLSLLCTVAVCHFLHLQCISVNFTDRGSICPLILVFYLDSMLVCVLSLVVTLLVRWMAWTSAAPPSWMSAIAINLQGSLLGRLLLYFQQPQQVADTEGAETSTQMGSNWRLIGSLLDRISFITFSVIYCVLFIAYYSYYL
jgi:hypothetical protein